MDSEIDCRVNSIVRIGVVRLSYKVEIRGSDLCEHRVKRPDSFKRLEPGCA
jgi:hypothetical protein